MPCWPRRRRWRRNARVATTDLGALRTEVDATVRKVEQLVDEVNRKWPFARDTELKLQ